MKLLLLGYGRMGRAVEAIARERGHEITAVLDAAENPDGAGITDEALAGARVAIDFTTPATVLPNVRRAAALGVNVVVGTTGWEDDRPAVEAAVREAGTGLLHAPNFSIGMLLFTRIVSEAARLMDRVDAYDVHLAEAHHRHKTDHPSGTARRLIEVLLAEVRRKERWSMELAAGAAVDPETLQVSVTRAGEIAGIHTVAFDGPDDRIILRHEAAHRTGFARGAVLAAEWLEGRSGLHTMTHLMNDLLAEGSAE